MIINKNLQAPPRRQRVSSGEKICFVSQANRVGLQFFSVLIRTDQKLKINKIVVKEGDRIKPQNQGIPCIDSVGSCNRRSQSQILTHTDSVKNGNDY